MAEYYTLNDAAEYLGVSRMKLWRLVKTGKLHTITNELDNREKLIDKAELDALKAKAPVRREKESSEQAEPEQRLVA